MDDLSEYRELYIQTSKEYIQNLNASLLVLEKNPADAPAIDEIFRSAHSLKSQSAAMGYQSTGFLCHTVEDVCYEIKKGRLALTAELADHLFTAIDALGSSLQRIEKENQETDLSQQAETLKQLSGVKTAGAGKTEHAETAPAQSAPAAGPAPPGAAQPTKVMPNVEAAANAPPTPAIPAVVNTIAVKVEVLDEMMNLLENLLVERLKLKRISNRASEDQADLKDYINVSEKILASMQHQIMKARAVPLAVVFDHFPRAVRDLARAENKQIELVITGGDLQLDRTIVDRLDEPLIHLLRNAVSHGIKDKGVITLSAQRLRDYAQISVADNGQGINWQQVAQKAGLAPGETNGKKLKEALFSGISTSDAVTQISGRGVGLTAIKKMVDNFGGTIDVISAPAKGAAFVIKLPLTLAIAKALIFTVGERRFALPMLAVERIVSVPVASIKKMADQEVFVLTEREVPLMRLGARLASLGVMPLPAVGGTPTDLLAVIVDESNEKVGLVVDTVLETVDVVIKPVPDIVKNVPGFSGVTILADGKTALIINPQELF